MTLHYLSSVIIKNNLSDFIENIKVIYAESTKNRPLWLKKVNVERLENVAWTRTIHVSRVEVNDHQEISGKTIYFGENFGYWQLNFTYLGRPYKLARPDCEFTLSANCHEKNLNIYIFTDEKRDFIAGFRMEGLEAQFTAINEAPLIHGITISIQNELDDNISNVNLTFSEEVDTMFIEEHANKIALKDYEIMKNESKTSDAEIQFSSCVENHIWKFNFVYANFCYELDVVNNTKMNLKSCDHGTTVEVVIFHVNGKQNINVKFKFFGREVNMSASKTCSLKEKIEDVKKRGHNLNRNIRKQLINGLKNLIESLKPLSDFYKTFTNNGNCSSSKFIQPCEKSKSEFEKVKIENVELSVISRFITESNGKIIDNLREVVKDLKTLKRLWDEIQTELNELKYLSMDVIDIRFLDQTYYNRSIDPDIKTIHNDLMRLSSMITVKILCQVLEISGCNEIGLMFGISNCAHITHIVIELEVLLITLKEELDLCEQLCFSLDKCVSSPVTTVMSKDFLEKSLQRGFEVFRFVRNALVERLSATALELHTKNKNVNITMITSSATAVAGAGAIIAGLIAAPFTAGLSLGLTVSGIGMTAAGGATGLITGIVDSALTSTFLKSTVDLVRTDQSLSNLLSTLQMFLSKETTKGVSEDDKAEQSACQTAELKENVTHAVSNVGVRAAKFGAQLSRFIGLRIIGIAPGLVFDITSLIINSINLAKGGRCELGYKLEMQAIQLQESLPDLQQLEN